MLSKRNEVTGVYVKLLVDLICKIKGLGQAEILLAS